MSIETTYIFGLEELSEKDRETILDLQKKDAHCFRVLFNNSGLTTQEIQDLRLKFNFSSKFMDYLLIEVAVKHKQILAEKRNLTSKLNKLIKLLAKTRSAYKIKKLKKEIKEKEEQIKHVVVFGGRKNLQMISKLKNKKNRTKEEDLILEKHLKDYTTLRLGYLMFQGETSSKGSRFFDFNNLSKGEVVFKWDKNTHIKLKFNPEKHIKDLILLEQLAMNKQVSLAVKLSVLTGEFHLTFDKKVLNQFKKPTKKVQERYAGIDQNPDGIGLVIKDKLSNKIINKLFISTKPLLNKTLNANKRNNNWIKTMINIFKILEHYRVHYLVVEDLNFKSKDLGSTEVNRICKNSWNTTLIEYQILKRSNELGIELIYVNPAYSSFVGNLKHNAFDPIASAIEIVERGIIAKSTLNYDIKKLILTEYKTNRTLNGRYMQSFVNFDNWIALFNKYKATKSDRRVRQRDLQGYVKRKIILEKNLILYKV